MTESQDNWTLYAEATILGATDSCEGVSHEFGSEDEARRAYSELKQGNFGFADPKTVHIVTLRSPNGHETVLYTLVDNTALAMFSERARAKLPLELIKRFGEWPLESLSDGVRQALGVLNESYESNEPSVVDRALEALRNTENAEAERRGNA